MSKDLRHALWLMASCKENAYIIMRHFLKSHVFQNHNGVSGLLQLRITSNGCKDDISQWGFIREGMHSTTQRFYREGKITCGIPPEEIHL
jgi:hypothetical protein